MQTRDLTELVHFSDEEARRSVLYDSDRVFAQVICLQDNQLLGPMSDPDSEGIVTILAGEVAAQIGKGRARMKQWETALVLTGEDLTLRNASAEPAVVLLVLAPPPRGGDDDGDAA
jgi:glyoxylate utilization-related uncharacterized protein